MRHRSHARRCELILGGSSCNLLVNRLAVGVGSVECRVAGDGPREIAVSQAPHLHPEFGWFCPSLSLRRKARIALITLVFSVVVGVVALKPAREPGIDGTPTI